MVEAQDRIHKLWADFAETKNLELRNQLVMNYISLVKVIVMRMMPTYRKHVDYDDLMSCGLLGLMDAIDKFDITKQVKFETYASLRIKGEIVDQLRKQDWAPISLRQKIKKIEEGFDTLEAKNGRTATEEEVAKYVSLSVEDVKRTMDESHTFNLVALDEILVDRMHSEEMLASSEGSPEENFENKELKQILAKCVDMLPEKEKMVVSLYYSEELTLREIGDILGVSESRVSQIHAKALMLLKSKMKNAYS